MRRIQLLLLMPVYMAGIGGIMFGSAGRWDLPWFWAYLFVWFSFALVIVLTADPDLTKERLHPGESGKDNLPLLRLLAAVLTIAHWVIAGLDVGRFHWSGVVPFGVQIAGLVGFTAGLAIAFWAMKVNKFFSSAVRIQRDRGHYVITEGPYRYVRHPGYAAFILVMLCSGLLLGSWWSLLPPLAFIVRFIQRATVEDHLLQTELEGYTEYAEKVRYRLVPGLW